MLPGLLLLPWLLQLAAVAAEALWRSDIGPLLSACNASQHASGTAHGEPHELEPPRPHSPSMQAREYLFFRLYGVQQVTPIVIMTSDAKGNHERVTEFMESCDWYGRGRKSFRSALQAPCRAMLPSCAGHPTCSAVSLT